MNLPFTPSPLLLERLLILLAAGMGGITVWLLLRRIDLALMLAPAPGRTVAGYAGQSEPTGVEDLGHKALSRAPVLGTFLNLPAHLRWLALTGDAPAPAAVVGLAVLLGLAGLLLAALTLTPALALLAVLGFLYPFLRIRSRADKVRTKVERSLPELAAILAAEMSAGLPPDQALERAGSWTGPIAALLRQVSAEARRSGRPVFGRGRASGALVSTIAAYDLPGLRAFASQIEAAARKGVAGPELMNALVRTYIVAYEDKALQAAEKLETRLAVPSVLFFFLPLLMLILVPLMLPILNVL